MERISRRRLLRDGAGAGVALAAAGSPALRAATAVAKPGAKAPPYAAGFRSLTDEIRLPDVPVDGDLPRWLRGALLRNGPALFEIGEQKLNHWFDGLAMLHAFSFGRGRVSYANRFLRSSQYESWRRTGAMAYSEFATDPIPDPCRAIYSGVSTLPVLGPVPNANVSIERLGREFRAHTEIPVPVRFDPGTLRTLGVDSEVPNGRLGTAHPHRDPKTGERFSYECELVSPSGLRIVSERRGRRRELAFIPQARPGYLHSFALTRRYVAVFTQPWEFDLAKFLGPGRGPIATNYVWDGSVPSKIYLVDRRRGGVAAEFELDPFFVFHHINAFDDGDRVVMDVCAHRDSGAVEALYMKNLRSPAKRIPQAAARRLSVDPSSGRVRVRDLAEGNIELPQKDYANVNARPYRYAYGVGAKNPGKGGGFINQLAKLDVERGEMTHWREDGSYPGEPVFVRRPGSDPRREDDGILLSVVFDGRRRTSYLLVLDARDLGELARAAVPHHIPFGFHGIHAA
jgi:carotenoid cleavage dioxygenase-like enzyme